MHNPPTTSLAPRRLANPELERRLASLDAAANYLDCGTRTIRRMIAAGEITGYRIGKRMLRIDLNELDALLRQIPSAREAV